MISYADGILFQTDGTKNGYQGYPGKMKAARTGAGIPLHAVVA